MKSSKAIIIVGTGASAQVMKSQFMEAGLTVAAFAADKDYCTEKQHDGTPLIALGDLPSVFSRGALFHVAVGYSGMGALRAKLLDCMMKLGFTPYSYISPSARISAQAKVQDHCYIGDHVSIQPFAVIQQNTVILSGSTVGHHATIASNCYICQHVNINGYVHIGEYSFAGAGSTLLDGVHIGEKSFIGACARVNSDMPEDNYFCPITNTVYSDGSGKFAAWFSKRKKHYALHDH